ncbi:thiamine biosynthesis protein ThiF [Nonomuraea sp. NPDC050556]|uniref:thiamine biosynthesis protein ThiF n=1 Tax=Nonomuraea sp. NPDC050556 TaxID=3364369 RepID=UPI0037AB5302
MRPRVKPALRRIVRDERTLQFGVQPGKAVLLTDLSPPVRRWIDSLDGTRDLRQVMEHAALAGLDEPGARSLLDRLAVQGVLDDAAASPGALCGVSLVERDRLRPDLDALDLASTVFGGGVAALGRRRDARVRVYGAGRVGAQVVGLLAASGVGHICVVDGGLARAEDLTPGGLGWGDVGLPRQDGAVALARRITTPPSSAWGPGVSTSTTPSAPPTPAVVSPVHEPIRNTPAALSRGHGPTDSVPTAPSLASRDVVASGAGGPSAAAPRVPRQARGSSPGASAGHTPGRRPRPDATSGRRVDEFPDTPGPSVNAWTSGTHLSDGSQRPDLVVLAPVGPLDGVLVTELLTMRIPHLLVSASEGYGCVGPLVLPGETACLHCLDLTRRDRDPAWPVVTARLGGYPVSEVACDTMLAALVAAAATGHALAHLDGREHVVTNGTMDICPDWRWRRRSWAVHPQCRCMRNDPYALTMVTSAGNG